MQITHPSESAWRARRGRPAWRRLSSWPRFGAARAARVGTGDADDARTMLRAHALQVQGSVAFRGAGLSPVDNVPLGRLSARPAKATASLMSTPDCWASLSQTATSTLRYCARVPVCVDATNRLGAWLRSGRAACASACTCSRLMRGASRTKALRFAVRSQRKLPRLSSSRWQVR